MDINLIESFYFEWEHFVQRMDGKAGMFLKVHRYMSVSLAVSLMPRKTILISIFQKAIV